LSFIEFSYNHSVYSTSDYFTFKIFYGFNPLTPIYLIPLFIDEKVSLDGNKKARVMKRLNAKIQQQIEKNNEQYVFNANKG
jgi:hypothetical protein